MMKYSVSQMKEIQDKGNEKTMKEKNQRKLNIVENGRDGMLNLIMEKGTIRN